MKTEHCATKTGITVYTTIDYFMFNQVDGNRSINQIHLNRLIASMKENYLFTVLIVNDQYEIIDGHHRFEAAKTLNLPIHYVICTGYGLNEVRILNQTNKTWNHIDYLNGYCNLGYKDYILFKRFRQKYGIGHNESMAMLMGKFSTNADMVYAFKDGKYKATHYVEACQNAEMLIQIKPYYSGYLRRYFVFAILRLIKNKNFNFSEFVQKLKYQQRKMVDCQNTEQYIDLIEEIYNYKNRNKVSFKY